MATFNIRIYTGPWGKESVREFHRVLKRSRVRVVSQGTEHVTIRAKGADCESALWNAGVDLNRKGMPMQQSMLLRRVGHRKNYSCSIVGKRKRKV